MSNRRALALGGWLLSLSCLLWRAESTSAALIGAETPIPDELVLVDFQGSGLDWVYAGPTSPQSVSATAIEPPSFRAAERWRYANALEWPQRPRWQDFIQPGYTEADVSPVSNWSDHTRYRFASEYWSDYTWVDLNDADLGYVTNGLNQGDFRSVWETWYVRSTVPEPTSLALLLCGLGGLLLLRRTPGGSPPRAACASHPESRRN